MFDTLLQDLRYAHRSMARRPGTTALAVVILALGIGASVSMFSVVDAVMLRPLPYPESDRLMSVYVTIPDWLEEASLADFWERTKWEYQEFIDWKARQSSFEQASLVGRASATLTGLGAAERVRLGLAGVGLFEMLGGTPERGRFFAAEDEENSAVALVTHGFWQDRQSGADDAVGQLITLDGSPYAVVGVLPEGFEVSGFPADVWIPVFDNRPGGYFPGNTGDMQHVFQVMGRLQPDVSPQLAEEELDRLLPAIGGEEHFTRHTGIVVPRLADESRGVRSPMTLLMAAVMLLLLVACANVATFLLGQAIDRQQEIAVRSCHSIFSRRPVFLY